MQSLTRPSAEVAAGVVHDLNGLLSLTLTHTELVRHRMADGAPALAEAVSGDLDEIAAATEEAALLVSLLAPPEPEPAVDVDLRACLADLAPRLRRLLAGAEVDLAGVGAVTARAERVRVEQAVLAMGRAGGRPAGAVITAERTGDAVTVRLATRGAGPDGPVSAPTGPLLAALGVVAGAGGSWSVRFPAGD